MIRLHCDAVLTVYDGFTGRSVTPSAVKVMLDGQRYRPQYREGGYLVFINLEPGKHEAVLSAANYAAETVRFETDGSGRAERIVNLKPGAGYPFSGQTTRLSVTATENGGPAAARQVVLATALSSEIKIAQDSVSAGETGMRLYFRSGQAGLKLPGEYLIVDGGSSEVCTLANIEGESGQLAGPLSFDHKRGKLLCPCQTYTTDGNGRFTAYFRSPSGIHIFSGGKQGITSRELAAGANEIEISVNPEAAAG